MCWTWPILNVTKTFPFNISHVFENWSFMAYHSEGWIKLEDHGIHQAFWSASHVHSESLT
jgi:hypothetical protein